MTSDIYNNYTTQTYIMTYSSDFEHCPVGVTNGSAAYWGGNFNDLDITFLIECHKDEVIDFCDDCRSLKINSKGKVNDWYPLSMGTYVQNGSHNGHPLYIMHQIFETNNVTSSITFYLYFRKEGK